MEVKERDEVTVPRLPCMCPSVAEVPWVTRASCAGKQRGGDRAGAALRDAALVSCAKLAAVA